MITTLLGDGESENYAYEDDEEEDDDYQKSDKQLLVTFRVTIVVSNTLITNEMRPRTLISLSKKYIRVQGDAKHTLENSFIEEFLS